MSHYEWTELDYVAGAAHELHLSYGQYVAQGCPNLQRFKRRVESGEFDPKPPVRRSRKSTLTAVAAKDKPPKKQKKTPIEKPVRVIPERKCRECQAVIPAEKRPGPPRQLCPACAKRLYDARHKAANKKAYEKFKARKKGGNG